MPYEMSLLKKLKPVVEKVPVVARTYRAVRDELAYCFTRPKATPWNFRFYGMAETWEEDTARLILTLPYDTFVDAGANYGLFSCIAHSRGKKVIAVEPLPRNVRYLRKNFALNRISDPVYPVALGDKKGRATIMGAMTGASLIEGWGQQSEGMRHEVEVVTLDSITEGHDEPLFIKIDVEGYEYPVLQGARRLLEHPRATWLMEICYDENTGKPNPHYLDTFKVMRDAGYRVFTPSGAPVTPSELEEHTKTDTGIGTNFLFEKLGGGK